ncbi:DUF2961 domain-containing protein [Chitinophaga sp. RCC_12]|uniref:DUF2961 domain-containing protein n=1 Tax=Chitinophaga sp. RCC_12 TaxID=3239226 RepID=UPI003525BD31
MIVAKHIHPLKSCVTTYLRYTCLLVLVLCKSVLPLQAQRLPVIPAGADAYRMWDKWPSQRFGMRTYMRSTYDRSGSNEAADASHYLFMNGETDNVTLDVTGTGILYFFRTNHWHGSPWHFTTDGQEHTVKETATEDPVNALRNIKASAFIPAAPFPRPLAWTWGDTKGADLIWTPIPFRQSLRIAYSRTHYGTGYYIYQLFANPRNLSQRINSWDIEKAPDKDVVALLSKAGQDIASVHIPTRQGTVALNQEKVTLTDIRGMAVVRALKFTIPLADAEKLERLRLLVTWDDASLPSIDAPLSLFFGAGTLHNAGAREYLVKGFPINIRYDSIRQNVVLACYYPMPFFKAAKFELAGITPGETSINYEIRYRQQQLRPAFSSYFHATYRDFPSPELGEDLTLLDTRGMEGKPEWSGNFVGTSFIFTHSGDLGTLEGDPRFFFDDSQTPQAQGTGTEEWGGGGDYWGGRNMSLPLAGHPCGVARKEQAKEKKDLIHSAYRFLLADLMPFGRNARIQLEHGVDNRSTEHYESVTYWYGLPAPSLIKTDELDIGDPGSEQQHGYHSPQASPVATIVSRYELGVDSLTIKGQGRKEIYPVHTEDGRYTTGVSEFTIRLDPANVGALLRRTLDYSHPNQKAAIYIADDNGDTTHRKWKSAGTWYLAGANTCMHSNPPKELDKRVYEVQTSNRRFRDDEWLIPAALTKGRSRIRVRIVFMPVAQELYPGLKFPGKNAWSELRYAAYSYVVPDFKD